jgi:hypothetical protein
MCAFSGQRYVSLLLSLLISISGSGPQVENIKYLEELTIPFDWESVETDTLQLLDTMTDEVLYRVSTGEDMPLYFYHDLATDVCFDQKCRPIQLKVFWNITGRYLGFELVDGEYLSRRDHEAFEASDYERLHFLLADPLLPFAKISFEELIDQARDGNAEVDAISGATTKQLSEYVVEGAAYTTFVLWNTIYGPLQAVIADQVERELTPALLSKILQSSSSFDQLWGLQRIDSSAVLDRTIEKSLLAIIDGADYFVAYTAINSIDSRQLRSHSLQDGLFSIYERGNRNLRSHLVKKLNEADKMSPALIANSRNILGDLNGNELGHWLDLYDRHAIKDRKTWKAVVQILDSVNRFQANKAYQFLVKLELKDKKLQAALKEFKLGR